jgi:hypothetical protein
VRNLFGIVAVAVVTATSAVAQSAPSRVLGVVTQVSSQGFVVKSDAGESATVGVAPETSLRRVPPGERDLTKATAIQATDISAGDRVLVRGTRSGGVLIAQQVIVMSSTDIAKKQEQDRAEWTQRGIAGLVTAVDPTKGEITVRIPSLTGQAQTTTVVAGSSTQLRRYAPDSVRFSDAKASTLAGVKVGDQLRAKGQRTPDGARLTADEIVTGSFRTVAGTVVSATTDAVQIKQLETGTLMDIRVTPESTLKRFPVSGGGPMGQGRPPSGSGTASDATPAQPPAGARQGGPGGPGGEMRRPDLSQMLERLPVTTAAELKPGDTVVVSSTVGTEPDKLTAIVLLAGAERLIAMQQQQAAAAASQAGRGGVTANWNLGDMSMMPLP